VLNHTPVEHSCRHIPPSTFLLQVVETLENDTFPLGETVSNIRERVTRVTGRHRSMLFALVSLMYLRWNPCSFCTILSDASSAMFTMS